LNELEWSGGHQHRVWDSVRQAASGRPILAEGLLPLLVESFGPWLKRNLHSAPGNIFQVTTVRVSPDAGEVRLTVGCLWDGRCEIRFSVGRTGDVG